MKFGRNGHGVTPEAMIEAREAAKPPVEGAVIDSRGARRLVRTYPAPDHSAYDAATARERRRGRLPVIYGPDFVLSDEVAVIFGDVAARLSTAPAGGGWAGRLDRVLRGVAPTYPDEERRGVSVALRDIARLVRMPIAEVPRFGPESLADGSWLAVLVDACRPLDEPLSDHLGREVMRREQSRARGIEPEPSPILDHLRVLDRAAAELDRELSRLTGPSVPVAVGVDPMDALRRKHSAEMDELRKRHRAEWAEASAAVKAARLAQVAAK